MGKNNLLSLRSRVSFLLVSLLLGFVICSCAGKGPHLAGEENSFQDGRLFLPDGVPLAMEAFAAMAAKADYILIGENHDAPHHHLMQARLIEAMTSAGLHPAVGFEMLYSRNQDLLEAFNRREVPVEDFEESSGWQESWSYPFAIYEPVLSVAERFNLPVYGLNISKATLDKVKALGFQNACALPKNESPDLPEEVILPMEEQVTYLHKLREGFKSWPMGGSGTAGKASGQKAADVGSSGSGTTSPMAAGDPERFMLVQSLWDTSMAESAIRAHETTGRPVVIIAGNGHVEHGYGIAHRIRTLRPESGILLVSPISWPLGNKGEDRRTDSADVFFASRPGIFSLGLVFKAEAERIIVDALAGGSRAEAAGLRIGDRIISLDGKELESPGAFHSSVAIADLMDKRKGLEGKSEKSLVIERAGEKKDLVLY